jgi:hypothetical protein
VHGSTDSLTLYGKLAAIIAGLKRTMALLVPRQRSFASTVLHEEWQNDILSRLAMFNSPNLDLGIASVPARDFATANSVWQSKLVFSILSDWTTVYV